MVWLLCIPALAAWDRFVVLLSLLAMDFTVENAVEGAGAVSGESDSVFPRNELNDVFPKKVAGNRDGVAEAVGGSGFTALRLLGNWQHLILYSTVSSFNWSSGTASSGRASRNEGRIQRIGRRLTCQRALDRVRLVANRRNVIVAAGLECR